MEFVHRPHEALHKIIVAALQPPLNHRQPDRRDDPPPDSLSQRASESERFDMSRQNLQITDVSHPCLEVIHGFMMGRLGTGKKNLCGIAEPFECNPEPVNCCRV